MKHAHKNLLDHLNQKELDTHTHIKATKNETHTFKNIPLEVESTHILEQTTKNVESKLLPRGE
jgi:hypothetical protein